MAARSRAHRNELRGERKPPEDRGTGETPGIPERFGPRGRKTLPPSRGTEDRIAAPSKGKMTPSLFGAPATGFDWQKHGHGLKEVDEGASGTRSAFCFDPHSLKTPGNGARCAFGLSKKPGRACFGWAPPCHEGPQGFFRSQPGFSRVLTLEFFKRLRIEVFVDSRRETVETSEASRVLRHQDTPTS
ncbi:hypothetical protein GWK47_050739 [Chionoecetes opilio]|uniref:Uncharacterized protein n=1 Tax=Chionoecetes opilio TaxID=41210 RepID=A0A8J5CSN6_CHIOP|nr:hypothetical protein GWK47_050739 [Chionoecetes opilio]